MNQINILVIDDQAEEAQDLLNYLKRNDKHKQIGVCLVDNKLINCKSLEDYDVHQYGIPFDAVLIDYQLNREFSGILVAAWMMLQLRVPRITLTSASYPGPSSYFNSFIRKDEIADHPQEVIERIVDCVKSFNYDEWLSQQYQELANQYGALVREEEKKELLPAEKAKLDQLNMILDKYDKLLDAAQEKQIKEKEEYISTIDPFREKEQTYTKKMDELMVELEKQFSALGVKK